MLADARTSATVEVRDQKAFLCRRLEGKFVTDGASDKPRRWWVRLGQLVAFAGGGLAGFALYAGLAQGWGSTPILMVLVGGGILWVSHLVARRAFLEPEEEIPLPGEVYGDRERPDPMGTEGTSLDGRIPFSQGKGVVKRDLDPRVAELQDKLKGLNQQLQRANVKLGLGELSKEGYQRIVTQIKERRAKVEEMISQQELVSDGTQ